MAEQTSFITIRGKLSGLSFYRSAGINYVRTAGGVSKDRILNDPSFVRTRENMEEFKNISRADLLLRTALASLTKRAKDSALNKRLFSLFTKIKNMDTTSARGSRQVAVGIESPDALSLFKPFDLNSKAPLTAVLHAAYTDDIADGKIEIDGFNPQTQLIIPSGATDVSFTSALALVNFGTGAYEVAQSPVQNMSVNAPAADISLVPAATPEGTGTMFSLLLIEFFQQVNGKQYSLNNGNFNVLTILDSAAV